MTATETPTERYRVFPYPGPHGRVSYGVTDTAEAHPHVLFWSSWRSAANRWCRRVNERYTETSQ